MMTATVAWGAQPTSHPGTRLHAPCTPVHPLAYRTGLALAGEAAAAYAGGAATEVSAEDEVVAAERGTPRRKVQRCSSALGASTHAAHRPPR